MSFETIDFATEGRVATITLQRPEKLNAISMELQGELLTALETTAADPGIHVAIVAAAGRAFSAGYDITGGSTGSGEGLVPKAFNGVGVAHHHDRRSIIIFAKLRHHTEHPLQAHAIAERTLMTLLNDRPL